MLVDKQKIKYNGWLVSDNIIKRSLAVVGHYILGFIIIYFFIFLIALLIALIGWLFDILIH